jgi:folate-dependent phosphoribosylglycinamide formyltransferase PurN
MSLAIVESPRPLRVGAMVTGTGGNLEAMIRMARRRPDLLELGVVLAGSPSCRALMIAEEARITTIVQDFEAECGRWSQARTMRDRQAYRAGAEAFHNRLSEKLADFELRSGPIDLLALAYGYWVHGELLERFDGRMINQHPGDLTQLAQDDSRRFVGNDPVLSALRAGSADVRASTFVVNASEDAGAIVCQGPRVPTEGYRATRADATRLESIQKERSEWPSLVCALTLFAHGDVHIDKERPLRDGSPTVAIRGRRMPFGGLRLEETADRGTSYDDILEVVEDCAWD